MQQNVEEDKYQKGESQGVDILENNFLNLLILLLKLKIK